LGTKMGSSSLIGPSTCPCVLNFPSLEANLRHLLCFSKPCPEKTSCEDHCKIPLRFHIQTSKKYQLNMFSKFGAKLALRKAGIPSNTFDFESKSSKPSDPTKQNELLPFANPFANVSVPKSWGSWATPTPPPVEIAIAPAVGTRAPSSLKLRLPTGDGRPAIVVFLRHCGCPCKSLFLLAQFEADSRSCRKDIPRSKTTRQQVPEHSVYRRIA
jgi:hypothetical protein